MGSGTFRCGKTLNLWNVFVQYNPGQMWGIDPLSVAARNDCISLRKLVSLSNIPLVLLRGAAEDSTFIGWSFGCRAASSSALFLNVCLSLSRALTMLDDRLSNPSMGLPVSYRCESCVSMAQLLSSCYVSVSVCVRNLIEFESVLRFRHRQTQSFVCHMTKSCIGSSKCQDFFQTNSAVHGRRALYTITADVYEMTESDHYTLGQDHAWDIAGRIRGGFGESEDSDHICSDKTFGSTKIYEK